MKCQTGRCIGFRPKKWTVPISPYFKYSRYVQQRDAFPDSVAICLWQSVCKIFFVFVSKQGNGQLSLFRTILLRGELSIILFIGYVGMKCLFSFKISLHNYAHFTLREKRCQNSFESEKFRL